MTKFDMSVIPSSWHWHRSVWHRVRVCEYHQWLQWCDEYIDHFHGSRTSLVDEISSSLPFPSLVEHLQETSDDSRSSDYHLVLFSLVSSLDPPALRHVQRRGSHGLHSNIELRHSGLRLRQWSIESLDLLDSYTELSRLHEKIQLVLLQISSAIESQRSNVSLHDHASDQWQRQCECRSDHQLHFTSWRRSTRVCSYRKKFNPPLTNISLVKQLFLSLFPTWMTFYLSLGGFLVSHSFPTRCNEQNWNET